MKEFLFGVLAAMVGLLLLTEFVGIGIRSKSVIKPEITVIIKNGHSDTTYFYKEIR